MQMSSQNVFQPDLAILLEKWAVRFTPDPAERQRLAVLVLGALAYRDSEAPEPTDRFLFSLMRRAFLASPAATGTGLPVRHE